VRAVWRPALALWGYRLATAWIVAYPLSQAVEAHGIPQFPGGDAVLFEPGGARLIELLRVGRSALTAAVESAVVLGVVVALVSLIPLAAVMARLANTDLRLGECLSRALSHAPPFVLLFGLALLAQAILLFIALSFAAPALEPLRLLVGPRGADFAIVTGGAVTFGLLAAIGMLHDLARAHVVSRQERAVSALRPAAATFLRHPVRVLLGWAGPAFVSLVVVAAAAWAVGALKVEQDSTWRLLAVFGVHQCAAFVMVLCRLAWLGRALGLSSRASREE
jgi:hypothetical protein